MEKAKPVFRIVMALYDGFDPTDIVGPHEVFAWLKNNWDSTELRIHLVAESLTAPETSTGLQILPSASFDGYERTEGAADMVFVPGGTPDAFLAAMKNPLLLGFITNQSKKASFICSVCFGAFILGQAGLLRGCEATTYWSAVEYLPLFPGVRRAPFYPRYAFQTRRLNGRSVHFMTGGGISSGIDQALRLAEILAGKAVAEKVQLGIQYNPRPPLTSGDPTVADPGLWEPGLAGFKKAYGQRIKDTILVGPPRKR